MRISGAYLRRAMSTSAMPMAEDYYAMPCRIDESVPMLMK